MARSLLLIASMRNAAEDMSIDEPMADYGAPMPRRPEIVLRTQFRDVGRPWIQPEHRLMLAVLEDAVQTYQTGCASRGGERRLCFRETAAWFDSDDTDWPFSFVSICEHLHIEPEYLRAGLRHWRERHRPSTCAVVRPLPFRGIARVRLYPSNNGTSAI